MRTVWGRGREGHFLYDAIDFAMSSLSTYISSNLHIWSCHILAFFVDLFSHFNGREISGNRERPKKGSGLLVPFYTRHREGQGDTQSKEAPNHFTDLCSATSNLTFPVSKESHHILSWPGLEKTEKPHCLDPKKWRHKVDIFFFH